jgi:predicted DNA-binding protein (MmcQ/YjbR family)
VLEVISQAPEGAVAKQIRLGRAEAALRETALTYPEAYEEFPWGERALKVKGKVFLFMYLGEDFLNVTVKLPVSGQVALALPFAKPTGYGLGKSGWVTSRFAPADEVPLAMLREWIDESFRAVAPKKLLAKVEDAEGEGREGSATPPAGKRRSTKKRTSK